MTHEPLRGLSRLAFKVRSGGLDWISRRLAAEVALPTTGPGQFIHFMARRTIGAAVALPRLIARLAVPRLPDADNTLFAFYDLKIAPITFDFLWFLVGADLQRRQLGLGRIHIVIVPGSHLGLRREQDDYEAVVAPAARQERVQNILMQSCSLLPACSAVTLAGSRGEAGFMRSVMVRHVFPAGYEPALPVYPGPQQSLAAARAGDRLIPALRATSERLKEIDRWIAARAGSRRVVTITMRNYGYMEVRNSNTAAWVDFAKSLDPASYLPVFIPDTDTTLEGAPPALREFVSCPEAAWNVGLRMALYERAFFNIGVNTGPMGLCWLNANTRYATLKMAPPGVPQTSLDYFRQLGFEPGRSLPFAGRAQELVWQDDSAETIRKAFDHAVAQMDSDKGAPQ